MTTTTTSTRFDDLEKLMIETAAFSKEWLLFQREHLTDGGSAEILNNCPSLYKKMFDFYDIRLEALNLYLDMCTNAGRRMHKDSYLEIIS